MIEINDCAISRNRNETRAKEFGEKLIFQDQRNFLKSPPKEVDFPWDFEAVQPMAQATLALDPNLENMRFQLVPKV